MFRGKKWEIIEKERKARLIKKLYEEKLLEKRAKRTIKLGELPDNPDYSHLCEQERLEQLARDSRRRKKRESKKKPITEIKEILKDDSAKVYLKKLILPRQCWKCPICDSPVGLRASLDHCHKTGKIRGVLCSNCNAGIGLLSDDPKLLLNALLYLTKERGII